jgi:hypothetical protein
MKKSYRNYSLFILISGSILTSQLPVAAQVGDSLSAVQWKPWQHSITTEAVDGRPPLVEAVFEGPSGKSFHGSAFTDDGIHFTIRAAFPEYGQWKWHIVSSNKSLENNRGKVEVTRYIGDNPLYHHGDIRISEDKRYLIYEDGSPFLWIGDTGWNAIYNSTMEEWKIYVDARAAQRFTVIQVNPRGVGNRSTASAKPNVSFRPDGTNNPEFWNDLENKIHYANEKGILIMMAGLGTAWRDTMAVNPKNQKFETYVAGRMASLLVVFSPSFDQLFEDGLDKIAAELRKYSTHLVTQHPGTNHSANMTFRATTSVDFSGLQTGHHGGDLTKVFESAREWTLDLWGGAPVKPIILLEAMYDAHGNNKSNAWREEDSRKPGWVAWFSGAKGFTYGAGDVPPKVPDGHGAVWMFNKDSSTYDYWQKAINWESAAQITNMHDFLDAIDWWNLSPSPELIRNQVVPDTLQMVVAKTGDSDLIVAYLPGNSKIILDMSAYLGAYSYTWFNPQTGRYNPSIKISGGDPNKVFERPEGWDDAVLKISKL